MFKYFSLSSFLDQRT